MKKEVEELAEMAYEYSPEGAEDTRKGAHTYESGMYIGFKDGYEAAKPKWIRVEDNPPPQWQEVLFLFKGHKLPQIGYRQVDSHTLGFENEMYLDTEDLPLPKPTHWMPLPEVEEDE